MKSLSAKYDQREPGLFYIILLFLFLSAPLHAQEGQAASQAASQVDNYTIPPLFHSDEVIGVTLKADFRAITRDIGDEREYHAAEIIYKDTGGDSLSVPLRLRTRGNFRRSREICDFPPLRLNFSSEETVNTIFHGVDKLKLVTHCRTGNRTYEQFVLQEYLLYRIYNLLTDVSFRVRLLRIEYIDTGRDYSTFVRYGFLIEDDESLAKRNGGIPAEVPSLSYSMTNLEVMTLMSMFQYMIGNTDWSINYLHNIVLITPEDRSPFLPVAYDFDFSGVIGTPYAIPDEKLPIVNVKQRLYRGYCRSEEELQPLLELFLEKRDEIYALYYNQEGLDKGVEKRTLSYYDKFYKTISNRRGIDRAFMQNCIGSIK